MTFEVYQCPREPRAYLDCIISHYLAINIHPFAHCYHIHKISFCLSKLAYILSSSTRPQALRWPELLARELSGEMVVIGGGY